jgi:hypothetical protein
MPDDMTPVATNFAQLANNRPSPFRVGLFTPAISRANTRNRKND